MESYLNVQLATYRDKPQPTVFINQASIQVWREYASVAERLGAYVVLAQHLLQLQFPVEMGIQQTPAYQAAIRRGIRPKSNHALQLNAPQAVHLSLHEGVGGTVPLIHVPQRADFLKVAAALAFRNEPQTFSAAIGAFLVNGYSNWDRIERKQVEWVRTRNSAEWGHLFQQLLADRASYQDSFMIITKQPYSGVDSHVAGMSPQRWLARSHTIRVAHESAHLFTKRAYGQLNHHLLDELVADYCGLVTAFGTYDASLALRLLGIDTTQRPTGRVSHYLPPMLREDEIYRQLATIVTRAAHTLQAFTCWVCPDPTSISAMRLLLHTISQASLQSLACTNALAALQACYQRSRK
ncbi:MAG: DUF7005 family protein [Candidatus Promineifilaceae bacterium]